MSFNLQEHLPALRYKSLTNRTWATTGTTDTVTDAKVSTNSMIIVNPNSVPAGRWSIACSAGSFVVTSSDTESSALTYDYIII